MLLLAFASGDKFIGVIINGCEYSEAKSEVVVLFTLCYNSL